MSEALTKPYTAKVGSCEAAEVAFGSQSAERVSAEAERDLPASSRLEAVQDVEK